MCGTNGKECATCYFGDGGCLAAMRDDFYCTATKEQIINRLKSNRYSKHKNKMVGYLKDKFNYIYEEKSSSKSSCNLIFPHFDTGTKSDENKFPFYNHCVPPTTESTLMQVLKKDFPECNDFLTQLLDPTNEENFKNWPINMLMSMMFMKWLDDYFTEYGAVGIRGLREQYLKKINHCIDFKEEENNV